MDQMREIPRESSDDPVLDEFSQEPVSEQYIPKDKKEIYPHPVSPSTGRTVHSILQQDSQLFHFAKRSHHSILSSFMRFVHKIYLLQFISASVYVNTIGRKDKSRNEKTVLIDPPSESGYHFLQRSLGYPPAPPPPPPPPHLALGSRVGASSFPPTRSAGLWGQPRVLFASTSPTAPWPPILVHLLGAQL